MNIELAERVWKQINAFPEEHNQADWAIRGHCGTSYCFAGWALVLSGYKPQFFYESLTNTATFINEHTGKKIDGYLGGRELLGLGEIAAARLFSSRNSKEDIKSVLINTAKIDGQEIHLDE